MPCSEIPLCVKGETRSLQLQLGFHFLSNSQALKILPHQHSPTFPHRQSSDFSSCPSVADSERATMAQGGHPQLPGPEPGDGSPRSAAAREPRRRPSANASTSRRAARPLGGW